MLCHERKSGMSISRVYFDKKHRRCKLFRISKESSMRGLETGKDKIQKICDAIRKETLEPAKQEVREMIENAHLQAQEIVDAAQKKAEEILKGAEKEMAERRRVFESSLQIACRQGLERLKQRIEEELFNRELAFLVSKEMGDPKIIGAILSSFMKAMEEKGIEDEFIVEIPKSISPKSISALLGAQILERLKLHPIEIADFSGGVQIRLKGRQITIDISDAVVRELISRYIRRDFRELVFSA